MKRWKRFLAVLLCLLFIQAPLICLSESVTVQAATVKQGLKKEKGKYYYYVNGKKLINKWRNIKKTSNGKTVTYRYYFGSNGAAYAGKVQKGIQTPTVKKINGKQYAFDMNGRMIKGACVRNDKFYVFNAKTGVYDKNLTSKYRRACAYEKSITELKKMLGKPKKTIKVDVCMYDGVGYIYYYSNNFFVSSVLKEGKEIVLGASGNLA